MSLPVEKWAELVRAGDVRAIARAITAIENHQPEAEELLQRLFAHTGRAYLTGVTGAPGTGKSTLVDRLAAYYRKHNEQVGVIAVDPTSPYTGGAILGDRIRHGAVDVPVEQERKPDSASYKFNLRDAGNGGERHWFGFHGHSEQLSRLGYKRCRGITGAD